MNIKAILLASTLFLFVLISSPAKSQPYITGRSVALSISDPLKMYGAYCNGANPAILASPDNPLTTIVLPSLGLSVSNNAFSPNYIGQNLVEGKRLTDTDISDILSRVKQDNLNLNGRLLAPILGFSNKNYALNALDLHVRMTATIPEEVLHLVLTGWEEDSLYRFSEVDYELLAYWSTSFSFGHELAPPEWLKFLAVGATFRYIIARNYLGLGKHEGSWRVTRENIETQGNIQLLSAKSGDGVGLDLGLTGSFQDGNSVFGITIGNLIGSINWEDLKVTDISFERNEGINMDSLVALDYWKYFLHNTDSTYYVRDFRTPQPRYLLFSLQRRDFYGKNRGDVYLSWYQGLNTVPGQNTSPRVSVGTEFLATQVLPLRLGIAVGGIEKFELSGGFGLRLARYRLDIGASWQRGIFYGAKGFSFAISNQLSLIF